MHQLFRSGALLGLALLAACAGTASREGEAPVAPFELNGRIVVIDGERRFTGSVRWVCADGVDDIWLGAPLGQTFAQVHADATGATLTTADQTTYRAGSIESLTERAFGWRFPAAGMRHWVRGLPSAGAGLADAERDGGQRLVAFTDGGWRVSLTYRAAGDAHPSRLDAQAAQAGIRLAIDSLTTGAQ
jgi:outer membrane lipoprotein LolB